MGQAAGALVAAERHIVELAEQKVGVSLSLYTAQLNQTVVW